MISTPSCLGEPEVVLRQRVLGSVPAADHAASAADAAASLGARAAEERIRVRSSRLAGVDADPGRLEGLLDADLGRVLPEQLVGRTQLVVGADAEHAFGGLVVGGELDLPVRRQPGPLGVLVEGVAGPVEGVGVAEAAAADPVAGDDEHVLEGRHPHDPSQSEPRHPEVAAQVPGGLGEVLVGESPAAFEDPDPVALGRQPQGADRSPEAGADHQIVEVMLTRGLRVHGVGAHRRQG